MEIIKHGKTYKAPQVKVCPVCECEFSYVKKDIKEKWDRITSEDSVILVNYTHLIYTYINCPECGKTIIIED